MSRSTSSTGNNGEDKKETKKRPQKHVLIDDEFDSPPSQSVTSSADDKVLRSKSSNSNPKTAKKKKSKTSNLTSDNSHQLSAASSSSRSDPSLSASLSEEMDKAKKNGEAGLEVKIDSLTKLVTTVVEENKQLRERLEIVEKDNKILKKDKKGLEKRLGTVEKRLAAVEKDLSKSKMRDIIKAFAESLVRTFAKFIPIASTSKKDVVEYWLISSRQDDFINKLIIQLETTDSDAHSKALTITDDVDKFISYL